MLLIKIETLTMPSNEQWNFDLEERIISAETPETTGTTPKWQLTTQQVITLHDAKKQSSRMFPELLIPHGGDETLFGVDDGSKLIRISGGIADAICFDTQPIPPLRWHITLPHGPEKLHGTEAESLVPSNLHLMLYSPLINPLTGNTIGPDRSKPKGSFSITNWSGTEADIWIDYVHIPFLSGDVMADVFAHSENGPVLLRFELPHRWWMIAPEPSTDAADYSKLPTLEKMKKRRMEEAEKAREAARQAARAKEPPPAPKPSNVPQSLTAPLYVPDSAPSAEAILQKGQG